MKKLLLMTLFTLFMHSYTIKSFASDTPQKIFAYDNSGIYYYYSKHISVNYLNDMIGKINKTEDNFHIFIFNKNLNAKKFQYLNGYTVLDKIDYLFDMITIGINNHPKYYIRRTFDKNNHPKLDICEIKPLNIQIKYTLNPPTGELINKKIFYNGKLGILSICNPEYDKSNDI